MIVYLNTITYIDELFGSGIDSGFTISSNSPAVNYVTPLSPISMYYSCIYVRYELFMFVDMLQWYWVPDKIKTSKGDPLGKRPYISQSDIDQMNSIGMCVVDLSDLSVFIVCL